MALVSSRYVNNTILENFIIALLYAACAYALQFFFYKTTFFANYPMPGNFAVFDAGWYKSIVEHGYNYSDHASNSGFFILLPWIWKLSHLGSMGMGFLNAVFFALGFAFLTSLFDLSTVDKLLWLSVPTVFFALVPYSEALFFLFSSLAIFGIAKGRKWLIWISLILLSLTRATAIFLMPAFLIMELFCRPLKLWYRSIGNAFLMYILPLAIGLAIFVYYQYRVTGIWFAYFKQQSVFWARHFSWPNFPLTSTEGNKTTWLSALAMFICFLSLVAIVVRCYRWAIKHVVEKDRLLVLSFMYLIMTLISIVFFNPKWGDNTTHVMGAHRYALMSPFFYIVLLHFTNSVVYTWKKFVLVIILSNAFWLLFGSYTHIQHVMFLNFSTVLICFYMLYANKKHSWPALVIMALNFFVQAHLFQFYISAIFPD